MSVVSARTFNQSPSVVKSMAKDGPVYVTDRGRPTVVVLDVEEYERLTGSASVRDSLRTDVDIAFEPLIDRGRGQVAEL